MTKIELPLTDDGEIDWRECLYSCPPVPPAKTGFFKAIAAHEREQCAKVAEQAFFWWPSTETGQDQIAQAIRERGKE